MHEGHILVVDDEPRLLSFLRSELRASGYRVSVATDGKGAIRAAAARGPELVILDVDAAGHGRVRSLPAAARGIERAHPHAYGPHERRRQGGGARCGS